jgi:hypothetical protein
MSDLSFEFVDTAGDMISQKEFYRRIREIVRLGDMVEGIFANAENLANIMIWMDEHRWDAEETIKSEGFRDMGFDIKVTDIQKDPKPNYEGLIWSYNEKGLPGI